VTSQLRIGFVFHAQFNYSHHSGREERLWNEFLFETVEQCDGVVINRVDGVSVIDDESIREELNIDLRK
jgi:hypothetical protein